MNVLMSSISLLTWKSIVASFQEGCPRDFSLIETGASYLRLDRYALVQYSHNETCLLISRTRPRSNLKLDVLKTGRMVLTFVLDSPSYLQESG